LGDGYDYLWSDSSTGTNFSSAQSGLIWVEARNTCAAVRDSIEITIHPKPSLKFGPDTAICGDYVLRSKNLSDRHKWNTGDTGSSILIGLTGNYFVTLTNAHGCVGQSDSIHIQIDSFPSEFLPNDTLVKKNETLELQSLREYKSYKWSTGSTQDKISINTNTLDSFQWFWLEVVDSQSCSGIDSISVRLIDWTNVFELSGDGPFKIYPNPSSDKIFIGYSSNHKSLVCTIASFNGNELSQKSIQKSHETIDVSHISQGVYLLTIEDSESGERWIQKLVISR
jgi:hypothetical protein